MLDELFWAPVSTCREERLEFDEPFHNVLSVCVIRNMPCPPIRLLDEPGRLQDLGMCRNIRENDALIPGDINNNRFILRKADNFPIFARLHAKQLSNPSQECLARSILSSECLLVGALALLQVICAPPPVVFVKA